MWLAAAAATVIVDVDVDCGGRVQLGAASWVLRHDGEHGCSSCPSS
jgi:hypothetical protein